MPIVRDKYVRGKWRRCFQWQSWELELLSHWKQEGMRNSKIAARFGVNIPALKTILHKEGFRWAVDWKDELPKLRKMVEQGRSTTAIARSFGVANICVRAACDRYGVPRPRRRDNKGFVFLAREVTRKVA